MPRERRDDRRGPPRRRRVCYVPGMAPGAVTALVAVACLVGGCGKKSSQAKERKDAGQVAHDALVVAPVDIAARPLGLPDPAAFGWRARAGQPAFREARAAERKGSWDVVIAACRRALAADPGHLEAAWLLAAALGRAGQIDEILAPLHQAVAGDFGKWGKASLAHPALQAFLASPAGEPWRRRIAEDDARYAAAVARGTVVEAGGDLYAVDRDSGRWLRLTRTWGALVGALRARDQAAHKIAYLVRTTARGKRSLAIGVVDLERGHATRPVELGSPGPVTLAYSAKAPAGFWIATGAPRPAWRHLADDRTLAALPPKSRAPAGSRLELARGISIVAPPAAATPKVIADWDEHRLAGAIRIGSSNRVVAAPSPGLIDGATLVWSPSRSHLAFVVQLDDCAPGELSSVAYVANAATGRLTELDRAARGLAIEWVSERDLAVAGDRGVAILDLDGDPPRVLAGADDLIVPRQRSRCAEAPTEAAEPPDEPVAPLDEEEPDAPVVEPP